MPTRMTRTRMDDQRKDLIDPKGPKPTNRPKQLQTHNLPTDDVEDINSTNKGRDLLRANMPKTEEQKGYCQRSRGTAELLYID